MTDFEKMEVVQALVKCLYALPNGSVGGYGHIVWDDRNLGDDSIRFCIEHCKNNPFNYPKYEWEINRAALELFLELPEDLRYGTGI